MDTTFTAPFTEAASQSVKQALYLAYGTNMWEEQMRERCPHSQVVGLGRLKGYKWIISTRGYPNIVALGTAKEREAHEAHYTVRECVYGLVYLLAPDDEARLDVHEGGAQGAYEKQWVSAEFWPLGPPSPKPSIPSKKRDMLVYIDHGRIQPSPLREPRSEQIPRMQHAIYDLTEMGCPLGYIPVLRYFLPRTEEEMDMSSHDPERRNWWAEGVPAKEEPLDKEALPTTELPEKDEKEFNRPRPTGKGKQKEAAMSKLPIRIRTNTRKENKSINEAKQSEEAPAEGSKE